MTMNNKRQVIPNFKGRVDKFAYIFPKLLKEASKKTEECLHFPGLAGIRITVGFLVVAG